MKTLLVLRHAKSDWSAAGLADHDRPLAPRGEADAPQIGAALAALGLIPDSVLTSTAVRARDTARHVTEAIASRGRMRERDAIYGASVDALLGVLRECDDTDETVLLVGHNPGLEELISYLTGGETVHPVVRMPTAALARLSLAIETWQALDAACGQLEWLLTPRVLRALMRTRAKG